ncbi:glycoside hydrolase family 3 C-terminal domain-containing protein [Demequina zhanjiangensis]|uniref:Glycoside hydrolase family 3 C-terminal domain-containing protein n=1 Tax=Demequina zhanjiangensis TaxID=3051659 RepID=A0ABT8G193_9MICO|nr:glycoside hydrolase family 3 C-terminal domain-containing protein [Demequina sp. SYSU T00b26]MDN4472903.1 glycoside hydrolase family 3 C-terminal domain-containing protein [Demequina sp. SYSU T00b26]
MANVDRRAGTRTQMTLHEKASLMSGANFWNTKPLERLGVPSIMLTDGPHGLRKQGGAADHLGLNASIPATCFPPAATLANTWDRDLIEQVGRALGTEAAAEDVSVLLGPGLNIKRNPLGGRSFEYFSEDPLVSGTLAGALARGIQSQGVSACLKHFAVNSQETHRMSVDEIVDERALHELYLEGFRIALAESDAWSVMTSYNKVNGVYANENHALLERTLRGRWGFDGLIVTDWGGNNDRVAGLRAGNALEMPSTSGVTDQEIVAAVDAGHLEESVLDARVDELLTLIDRTSGRSDAASADHDAHHALAIEAARRAVVLLRHENDVLPLGPSSGRVAVIGDFARTPRYQGAGSSLVNPTRLDSALDALRETGLDIVGYEPGFSRMDGPSKRRRRRALALAQRADVTVLFLGLDESAEAEAVDRTHMRLADNQLALVRELTRAGTRVIVVLAGGAPVELPFADSVEAILHGYLPGQGGGRAIADVLTGEVNPSGRLAETYPLQYEDVPSSASFGRTEATSEHRESIYLGYRYFDKVGMEVRYPFGHGLSYTAFAYSDLRVDRDGVRVTVTNTGERAGVETVQVYVEAPDAGLGQFRAPRELRGFAKVALDVGESAEVEIAFADHAFEVFDVESSDWRAVGGEYTVHVGASSRDLRLSEALVVTGAPMPTVSVDVLPHYIVGTVEHVDATEFEALLGRPLPPSDWPTGVPLTRDDIIAQTQGRGGFAGFLHWVITAAGKVLMRLRMPLAANNTNFALDMPFRSVARLSGGAADDDMVDGLLLMVNGQFWRGLRRTATAWRALRRRTRAAHRR